MSTKRQIEIDQSMHALGQRLRAGFAKNNPTPEKNIDLVKDTIRDQREKDRDAERDKAPDISPDKSPEPQPNEPDMDR